MKKSKTWKESVDGSLQELGLNPGEIELYTASTALGPISISALARHLGISRPSVYKTIDRLASLGLARLPDRSGGQAKFQVEPVTTVLEQIRAKRELCLDLDHALTAAMPDVLDLYNRTARPAAIRTYHGRAQLKYLYESILDHPNADIRFFGSGLTFTSFLTPEELAARTKRKVRAGIWNRCLVPSTESRLSPPNPEVDLREVRVFDSSSAFTTIFQLFAGKVIFWWPETLMAMCIEDAALFKMMGSIFSRYWESGIPYREFFGKDGYPLKGAGQKLAA